MLKSLTILTIAVAVFATPADAKSKRQVAKKAPYTRCAGLVQGLGGCNPMQMTFSPVVLAADASIGIISALAFVFR